MIKIDDQKDPQLYYNVDAGVEFCRNIPDKKLDKKVNFHSFWVGDFGRKQSLPIKSFFATQDLENATLNLWSTHDLSNNEHLKPFKEKINFRLWDPVKEAKGTIVENLPHLNATDKKFWVDGDLFRLLALHKYGGVYFDMDIVLLRNFAPLLEQEFLYKWGTEKNMINGAVMHLNAGSQLSIDLLDELSRRHPTPLTTSWGNDVYVAVHQRNKSMTVFPAAFFNTEWQISPDFYHKYPGIESEQGLLMPFKKCEQSNYLFDGVFSWHWHGKWKEEIQNGSKWQLLEELTDNKLKIKGLQ